MRILRRLAALSGALFALLIILSLTTPSWRYGPFSWAPIWVIEHLAGGPVRIGILNLVPALFVAVWLAQQLRERAWTFGPAAIAIPLALFSLWALIRLDGASFRLLFIFGGDLILVWLVYLYYVNQRPPLRPMLAIVVLIQGVVGCLQFFVQRDLGLVALGELPLNPAFAGVTVLQARGAPWLRAYGLTAHPNLYGALLALCLLLIGVVKPRQRLFSGPIMLPVIVLGAAGLFFSFSRTAWLGAVAGLTVWFLLARINRESLALPSRWWLLLPLLLLAFALLAYGDLVLSRLSNLDQPLEARSINQRLADARLALHLAWQNPVLGVGLGMNVDAASLLDADAQRVHNVLLLAFAELGLPGLFIVVWLLLSPLIAFWAALRRRQYTRVAAGLAPWMAIIVVNQFDTTLWLTGNWQTAILFALAAGNVSVNLQLATKEQFLRQERGEVVHNA